MQAATKRVRIGVFGHYGNQNLGDESIIEAVIRNLRQRLPDADIVCLSLDPEDSRSRHEVDAFPIRYRPDFFTPRPVSASPPSPSGAPSPSAASAPRAWKARLKAVPILGHGLKAAARALDFKDTLASEYRFLAQARDYLRGMDLLLVTGSNQFLDNFGGPWGFPYTLLKWTLLAKKNGTRVAFISVGAGPLSHPLSFFMLKHTLRRADFVSFRDQGSLDLVRSRTHQAGRVYPDLAHSLGYDGAGTRIAKPDRPLSVALNPMPVYDSRYWHEGDEDRYQAYVAKVTDLCREVLSDGARLTLFSTQRKDENVIDDILSQLGAEDAVATGHLSIQRNRSVNELMQHLGAADLVVATRFHATVLPLQLGVPVLGICYYRKAAELLNDVGLGDYQVAIDDFDAPTLIAKYRDLARRVRQGDIQLDGEMARYRDALAEQYQAIVQLATGGEAH
ncbi:hypothetical protein BTO32_03060 [Marinobacter lutaoensis]|uniref:Polysaccharide pyruvyl transferase domain-containing protein n=1 Tax=Marinobacter lutaoensis TaxID=135739 RepID=A0A1V2DXQ1_9GAMM|nr:polysaccharide pyruvyl transferase family protein [Marinobacter lutaoensis]ONF45448.1 hypothetical protein BTO32_03060 [Marinobacter lutaoensis]